MIDIRKLINAYKNILCEFHEVSSGDVLTMELNYLGIDYLGIQKHGIRLFELDGIQFYQSGEDLYHAIETCIDEEFMPNWRNNYDVSGYVIENIEYEMGDDSGTVIISVY